MPWYFWLAAAVVAVVIAVFAIKAQARARREQQEEADEERAEQNLARGADNPEVDEDYAAQFAPGPSIEQVARNKGAI